LQHPGGKKKVSDLLNTSDAARILGKAAATVLYYERVGILEAQRTASGMRIFERAAVERLAAEQRKKERRAK
jgi:DNA-binding transcriptional MerR regulator